MQRLLERTKKINIVKPLQDIMCATALLQDIKRRAPQALQDIMRLAPQRSHKTSYHVSWKGRGARRIISCRKTGAQDALCLARGAGAQDTLCLARAVAHNALCLARAVAHDTLCLAEKLGRKTHYVLQERRGARHIMSCKGRRGARHIMSISLAFALLRFSRGCWLWLWLWLWLWWLCYRSLLSKAKQNKAKSQVWTHVLQHMCPKLAVCSCPCFCF